MSFERVHRSSSQTPQSSWSTSQSAPRPFPAQEPKRPPTQEELENQAFQQDKFEATGLQLKEQHGIITPVEQERLGMLQAKMDSFWAQRMERAKAQPDLLEIFIRNAQSTITETTTPIQPKLIIGEPNDRYEKEADRIASEVINRIHHPEVQQMGEEEGKALQLKRLEPLQWEVVEEGDNSQMKPVQQVGVEGGAVLAGVEREIDAARGGGQPLAPELQNQMGQAIQADFSGVRVHTDAQADHLNRRIGARAFTAKQDLFFKQGEYQPWSRDGQKLIAHELTHVVQQNNEVMQRNFQPARVLHDIRQEQSTPIVQRAITIEGVKHEKMLRLLDQFLEKTIISHFGQESIYYEDRAVILNQFRKWTTQNKKFENWPDFIDEMDSILGEREESSLGEREESSQPEAATAIHKALTDANLSYAIQGSYAARLYGAPVEASDIDVLVNNVPEAKKALADAGFKQGKGSFAVSKWTHPNGIEIDLVFGDEFGVPKTDIDNSKMIGNLKVLSVYQVLLGLFVRPLQERRQKDQDAFFWLVKHKSDALTDKEKATVAEKLNMDWAALIKFVNQEF